MLNLSVLDCNELMVLAYGRLNELVHNTLDYNELVLNALHSNTLMVLIRWTSLSQWIFTDTLRLNMKTLNSLQSINTLVRNELNLNMLVHNMLVFNILVRNVLTA